MYSIFDGVEWCTEKDKRKGDQECLWGLQLKIV